MPCQLDRLCTLPDLVSDRSRVIPITLTEHLALDLPKSPGLAVLTVLLTILGALLAPTRQPRRSKVVVSLQRGIKITKCVFSMFCGSKAGLMMPK